MPNGYMGKVLWVDLSKGTWEEQTIEEDLVKQYMTGYGLTAKLIFDKTEKGIDPLGPKNILGFSAGLLTGSSAFFSGRYMMVAKSPLTGGWGDANSGGTLAPEIKKCGYDAILFTGKSKKPVYFQIDNGEISINDAKDMWGKDAFEAEEAIWEKAGHKKFKVASIGQSGENLSLMAGIVNDKGRIAARSGLGAVMGSKNLKAIALRGKGKVGVADRDRVKDLNQTFKKFLDAESALYPTKPRLGKILRLAARLTPKLRIFPRDDAMAWRAILKRYGTSGVTAMSAVNGDSPVKNWKGSGYGDFPPNKSRNISDEAVLKYQEKRYGCIYCPIKCGGVHKIEGGEYPLEWTHKPEYETLCQLGTLLLIDDLFAIYKANEQCNAYGLDTISVGGAIAFAIEAYENGVISKDDTGGLELRWGDPKVMLEMVEKIAFRKDIGDVLADGVKKAAEKLGKGSDAYAVHAGGQELPAHDPRYDPGFAVIYAAEPTPGRHTITSLGFGELQEVDVRFFNGKRSLFTRKGKRYKYSGKGKFLQLGSTINNVGNGAGLCLFGMQMGKPMPVFEYLNAVTGWDWSDEQWMEAGERIEQIRHAFNVREGITIEDTKCTPRTVGRPALTEGPNAGITIDEDTMLRDFYDAYGWEYPSGKPKKEKLEELGQKDLLKVFYEA